MLSALAKVRHFGVISAVCKNLVQVRPETCCSWIHVKTIGTTNVIFSRGRGNSISVEPVDEEPVCYPLEPEQTKNLGKIIGLNLEDVEVDDSIDTPPIRKKKSSKNLAKLPRLSEENLNEKTEEVAEKKQQFEFTNLGRNGHVLGLKIPNLKSRKHRDKEQQILVEGKRLINEALAAGCEPVSIFFSRQEDLQNLKLPEKVKLYKICYKNIQLWSDVVTSQGVLAIFKMPDTSGKVAGASTIPLIVICDNIRDPGNMGAVLRVVASVGCEQIILTKGCVDIWDSKVLRAGAGSHFRMPITVNLDWKEIEKEIGETERVVLADNVNPLTDWEEKDVNSEVSNAFKTRENPNECDLPLECYASVDYCTGKTVIVIGGETLGLSNEAYAFARKRQGLKVGIPMSNNIESLNTAVALGILCYEVRRQWDFPSMTTKKEPEKALAIEANT